MTDEAGESVFLRDTDVPPPNETADHPDDGDQPAHGDVSPAEDVAVESVTGDPVPLP